MCANGQGFVGGVGALQSALGIHFPIPPRSERSLPPAAYGGSDNRPPPGTSYTGSGFAVDGRHVLTNAHVIEGMSRVDIANEQTSAPAEIVFVDRATTSLCSASPASRFPPPRPSATLSTFSWARMCW
jgi:S1-C subfamily serine protease